jgi:hypothetical protein
MEKKDYKKIVDKYTKKENRLINLIIAFIFGGLMGLLGNFLVDKYICIFGISKTSSSVRSERPLELPFCPVLCL